MQRLPFSARLFSSLLRAAIARDLRGFCTRLTLLCALRLSCTLPGFLFASLREQLAPARSSLRGPQLVRSNQRERERERAKRKRARIGGRECSAGQQTGRPNSFCRRAQTRRHSPFSFAQDASVLLRILPPACRRKLDQSFDETSMDSCPLAAITEARGNDLSKDGSEVEVTSLEEAKSVIAALRVRQRAQAHQMLAWWRTLKLQEDLVARLTREKAEQLRTLSSQLLLFESRLCRKQKEIEASLAQRESIILRQQRVIRQLQSRLAERSTGTRDSPPCDALDRLDSLGDSDSAVVLEEAADDLAPPRFRSNITDVTVIRSVSDAVEPSSKYSSMRRCNGFLRRPEILETVYSVEEDGDSENNQDPSESTENSECEDRRAKNLGNGKGRLQDLYGSFERLAQEADSPPSERPRDESQQAQVTYNRVMSNHRSVTKPKDVKYKRINKAKSKSLEELRGRLRNWVEKGNKIAISLDQSYA